MKLVNFILLKLARAFIQELQKDIEKHDAGVSSVMELCDALSRDSDACPTAVQTAAISAARTRLEKRWNDIRDMCLKKKRRLYYVTVYPAKNLNLIVLLSTRKFSKADKPAR